MAQGQLGALVRETKSAERSTHGILGDLQMKLPKQMGRECRNRPAREPVVEIARLRQNGLPQTFLAVGIDAPRPAGALSQLQAAEAESSVIVQPALHSRGMFPKSVADFRYRATFRGPQHGTKTIGVPDVASATQVVFQSSAFSALERRDEQNGRHGKPSGSPPTPLSIDRSASSMHSFCEAT
jgi:hypothetical protein